MYGQITPSTAPYGAPLPSKEEEIAMLEEQAKLLEQETNLIKRRLEELRK